MTMDENLARLRAHRNNINRYRRLLRTKLLPLEREFIERRLAEEDQTVESLSAASFPIILKGPRTPRSGTAIEVQL